MRATKKINKSGVNLLFFDGEANEFLHVSELTQSPKPHRRLQTTANAGAWLDLLTLSARCACSDAGEIKAESRAIS
jgi:hypothetical protein